MTDFLYDPLVWLIIGGMIAIIAIILQFMTKPVNTIAIERVKPGHNIVHKAEEKYAKNPGEIVLTLKDGSGRKFEIPEGKEGDYEVLRVPKSIRLKKGFRKLWLIENDQIVKFAGRLTEASEALITPSMIPLYLNRGSLKRALTAKIGAATGWTMVILAVGMGLAIGYILYPQFNHPVPVVEYCKTVGGNYSCGLTP